MASDRIDDLMKQIETRGEKFGLEASALSDNIHRLEQRLARLHGKEGVDVEADGVSLSFDGDGSGWHLWIADDASSGGADSERSWQHLRSASIERKAAAVRLVPMLLEKLAAAQEKKLSRVEEALGKANLLLSDVLADRKEA